MKKVLVAFGFVFASAAFAAEPACVVSHDGKSEKIQAKDEAGCKAAAKTHCTANTEVTFNGKKIADACTTDAASTPASNAKPAGEPKTH